MDEETIEMPLTPHIIESNGNSRRNLLTPEVTEPKEGSLILSSTGRTRTPGSGEKVVPHYLRASSGSCHDSCKYGGHHSFERKEKKPIRKGTRILSSYDGQHPIVTISLPQMRKKNPSIEFTSPDQGIQSCDTLETNQHALEVEKSHPIPKGSKTTLSVNLQRRKKKLSVVLPSSDPTTKKQDTLEATQQAFEVKEKLSELKRTKATSLEGQHAVVSHLQMRKKKPSVKLTSPDSTSKSQDTVEATQQAFEVKEKLSVLKITKATSLEGQHAVASHLQMRKKKPSVKLTSPDSTSKSQDTIEATQQAFEVKGKHSILKSTKPTSFQGQNTTESGLRTRQKMPSAKLTSPDTGSHSHVTLETNHQEAKIIKQKILSSVKEVANVVKSSGAFKPRRTGEKSPSLLNLPKDQTVRRESVAKTGRTANTSKVDQKKDLVLEKAASYPKPSLNRITSLNTKRNLLSKGASPLKNENKTKQDEFKLPADEDVSENNTKLDEFKLPVDENVGENILQLSEFVPDSKNLELDLNEDLACVSSPSTDSSSLLSTSSSPPSLALHRKEYIESEYTETENESEYDESEMDSEYDETIDQNQLEETSNEHRRSRRAATVFPEDDDPGYKLKFRRGRVVDLQSLNNTPRRLRFKKGKVLGDDRNGKGADRSKNLRKMEGIDLPDTTNVADSGKVVLRHQDVEGKKDAQGLFNNVIEETASKLAETRKSKVKALVGAFETVISLQESKPSTTSHL